MLILTTSLLALILLFLPDVPTKFQGAEITFDESEEKFATIFKSLIDRFFSLTLFLSIPAAALFNKWLFKKQSYNYAEHVVIATFIASAVNIFSAFKKFITFSGSISPFIKNENTLAEPVKSRLQIVCPGQEENAG